MPTIGLCVVSRNRADELARLCEEVADYVDEIVLVDTGSSDKTKVVANRFGARIIEFLWNDDYSKPKNAAIENCSSDWILSMSARDMISRQDLKKIRGLARRGTFAYSADVRQLTDEARFPGFIGEKTVSFAGREYNGYVQTNVVLFFKNHPDIRWRGAAVEYLDLSQVAGSISPSGIIIHRELEDQAAWLSKNNKRLEILERSLNSYPNRPRGLRELGTLYLNVRGDTATAKRYFLESIALDDSNPRSFLGLGICYANRKEFGKAKEAYERVWKLSPGNVTALLGMVKIYELEEDYGSAVKLLSKLLDSDYPNKAWVERQIKEYERKKGTYRINVSLG